MHASPPPTHTVAMNLFQTQAVLGHVQAPSTTLQAPCRPTSHSLALLLPTAPATQQAQLAMASRHLLLLCTQEGRHAGSLSQPQLSAPEAACHGQDVRITLLPGRQLEPLGSTPEGLWVVGLLSMGDEAGSGWCLVLPPVQHVGTLHFDALMRCCLLGAPMS